MYNNLIFFLKSWRIFYLSLIVCLEFLLKTTCSVFSAYCSNILLLCYNSGDLPLYSSEYPFTSPGICCSFSTKISATPAVNIELKVLVNPSQKAAYLAVCIHTLPIPFMLLPRWRSQRNRQAWFTLKHTFTLPSFQLDKLVANSLGWYSS